MRTGTRDALERGTLDKFGRTHEAEQRAVLYVLDQLLSYVPRLQGELEKLEASLQSSEALANRPLYGDDRMMDLTDSL